MAEPVFTNRHGLDTDGDGPIGIPLLKSIDLNQANLRSPLDRLLFQDGSLVAGEDQGMGLVDLNNFRVEGFLQLLSRALALS